jgi:[acyl-carrier-protein] S-malonyltransferase
MVDSGVGRFVEFGAGGVLAGLIKRIDRDVEVSAVADPDSVRKLASAIS